MSAIMDILLDLGQSTVPETFTEEDTRAILIDPLLAALGWTPRDIRREPYTNWREQRGYLDYLLFLRGRPFFVVEAKKTARTFSLPKELTRHPSTTLEKVLASGSPDLAEAVDQCCRYSAHTGAAYACASNGHEYLFFKPFHSGRGQSEAKVVLYSSPQSMLERIDEFCDLIQKERVRGGSAEQLLAGREVLSPDFAKRLDDDFPLRLQPDIETADYSALVDRVIRNYLVDITNDESFHRCYVRVPWSRTTDDALDALLKNQLAAFNRARSRVDSTKVVGTDSSSELFSPSLVGRTVILHGAIGVGKTSYLRHFPILLKEQLADQQDQSPIWAHLDLLDYRDEQLDQDAIDRLSTKISATLRELVAKSARHTQERIDPEDWKYLRDIYNTEVRRFQKQRYPDSDDSDDEYIKAVREYIWRLKEEDPQEHFLRTLKWLTRTQNMPVVLVLDNSDQLGIEFQEFLYTLTLSIQRRSAAVTLLSLRTEALMSHRLKKHRLANVDEVFEVQRPSLVDVVARRCAELERLLTAEVERNKEPNFIVTVERLSVLVDVLRTEFERRSQVADFVKVVGNGNLRRTLDALGHVFRLSPKYMDKLVEHQARGNNVWLDPKRTLRAMMRTRRGRYLSSSPDCLVPNVFAVESTALQAHSLAIRVLFQVSAEQTDDLAPSLADVVSAFAGAGFDPEQVRRVIARLRRDGSLSVPHMFDDLSDDDMLRTTELGDGLSSLLMRHPEYLEGVLWDTLIYDQGVYERLVEIWRGYGAPWNKLAEMRKVFVEYLLADDAMVSSSLNTQFLAQKAAEPLRL